MSELGPVDLLAEDDSARGRALETAASFLVQAPAGSGKTELLIQRYLALLARVDDPGEIVALTFTNKAAGEMRERVLGALLDAERGALPEDRPHAKLTHELAVAALAQDRRRGWSVTEHPSRLRMQTFDALAIALSRRAPVAAKLGTQRGYIDDASTFYVRAAEGALARARADDASWRTLLLHFDNNGPQITTLIANMLARREQWLRQVKGTSVDDLRVELEAALRAEVVDVLDRTRRAFPDGIAEELRRCIRYAVPVLAGRDDGAEFVESLETCASAGGLPEADVEALPSWCALARFLLVKGGTHFKRALKEKDGFEPLKGPDAPQRRERKQAMESLCRQLDDVPGLAKTLARASRMPEPPIGEASWRIVAALLDVLPHAVAELTTVFAGERRIDFLQANLAALEALGDADLPSDLLLQLDANIRHLLVDEFQDTSHVQLKLLERLTSDWAKGDGRTLFVVGDPMQSIYRFREAEVAFFLNAQETGSVNRVPVECLQLRRNFRSQARIVDWCNLVFSKVLGSVADPGRGMVPFAPAVREGDSGEGAAPSVELFEDSSQEAARVVALIREFHAAGVNDIAILVRARAHLVDLLPALRRERIAFQAVELDLLSQRQAVLDLVALTHAVLQPADRAAWLAVLRAPWCGLTLADLLAIADAAGSHRNAPITRAFDDVDSIAGLSEDGRCRLRRLLDALLPTLKAHGEASAMDRVRGAWLELGGPACFEDPLDLDASTLYFELLSAHERAGDVPDWETFVAALDSLHASATTTQAGVQIMTMHKAKGLEFDTVILTGLAQEGRTSDAWLLRWRRRDVGLLIAPAKSRGGDSDPLHRYLADLDADAEDAELGRLLYVASTRAKSRLHLVAAPGTRIDRETGVLAWKEPAKLSSLAKLSPALAPEIPLVIAANAGVSVGGERPQLRRVPANVAFAAPAEAIESLVPARQRDVSTPAFDWARETARRIGTIAHRLLSRIADDGAQAWANGRIQSLAPRVRADLKAAGFSFDDELVPAESQVLDVIRRTLDDPRGRWLFDSSHEDARSEWALSGVDRGEIVRIVVDRTFVAGGERWIVDFKTGTHEGGDVQAFLEREVERYREQMARYGRMMAGLEKRTIRLALYYPLIEGGFREIVTADAALPETSRARKGAQLSLF